MREVVEIAEVEGLAFGDGRIGRGYGELNRFAVSRTFTVLPMSTTKRNRSPAPGY
jgi:hypothetical protein